MTSPLLTLSLLGSVALGGTTRRVPEDHPQLAAALAVADPGDTIRLGPGVHVVPSALDEEIVLVGAGPGTLLQSTAGLVVDQSSGSLTLRDLVVDGQGRRAVRCVDAEVILVDVVVTNGGVEADALGGGLLHATDCTLAFHDTRLEGASAADDGGLLYASGTDLTLVGGRLADGEAPAGGALRMEDGSLQMQGVEVFTNASTESVGGAARLLRTSMQAHGGLYWRNAADTVGGAVYARDAGIRWVDGAFVANEAATDGAITVREGGVRVFGGVFSDNLAGAGAGALRCREATGCVVQDALFQRNEGALGGGIYASAGDTVGVHRNLFCENRAVGFFLEGFGGGSHLSGGTVASSHNGYIGNYATQGGGGLQLLGEVEATQETFVGNDAGDGAAFHGISSEQGAELSVFATSARGAAVGTVFGQPDVHSSLFYDNTAGDSSFTLGDDNTFLDASTSLGIDLSGTCSTAALTPAVGSPLLGGGPAGEDLGAFGGDREPDSDGDGVPDVNDCDPVDPAVGWPMLRFADVDGDGYGDWAASGLACPAAGSAAVSGDCDDDENRVYPGAQEQLAGIDDDCDGLIDEVGSWWYFDADGDGYGDPEVATFATVAPPSYVALGEDCDDTAPGVHPGATEVCDPADVDEDCSGRADDRDPYAVGRVAWFADGDGDGFGGTDEVRGLWCDPPDGAASDSSDCDDAGPGVSPGADEVCDGEDNDCDGLVDDEDTPTGGDTFYTDADGDGFAGTAVLACVQPPDTSTDADDCDDGDPAVHPDADEVCDAAGTDEDCDGLAEDADPDVVGTSTFYLDDDLDGFGGTPVLACDQPAGTVLNADDCDDADDGVSPLADEVCGGTDEDCDGLEDDEDPDVVDQAVFYVDADADGFAGTPVLSCTLPVGGSTIADDCDDGAPAIHPGMVELCDALDVDEDCNGLADDDDPDVDGRFTWYPDDDADGFGDGAAPFSACDGPGVADGSDCDDTAPEIHPEAEERCDTLDNDCDGLVDDGDPDVVGQEVRYPDVDGDGFGDGDAAGIASCFDGVVDGSDCDDADPAVNPGATEAWYDGVDQDCDGNDDDQDVDGVPVADDCDDEDPATYPGAEDVPDDGIDQDCQDGDAVWVYGNGLGCSSTGGLSGLGVLFGFGLLRRRRAD